MTRTEATERIPLDEIERRLRALYITWRRQKDADIPPELFGLFAREVVRVLEEGQAHIAELERENFALKTVEPHRHSFTFSAGTTESRVPADCRCACGVSYGEICGRADH